MLLHTYIITSTIIYVSQLCSMLVWCGLVKCIRWSICRLHYVPSHEYSFCFVFCPYHHSTTRVLQGCSRHLPSHNTKHTTILLEPIALLSCLPCSHRFSPVSIPSVCTILFGTNALFFSVPVLLLNDNNNHISDELPVCFNVKH